MGFFKSRDKIPAPSRSSAETESYASWGGLQDQEPTKIISPLDQQAAPETAPLPLTELSEPNQADLPQSRADQAIFGEAVSRRSYRRIQFFPCLLGWLLAYGLFSLASGLYVRLVPLLGLPPIYSLPEAISQLVKPAAGASSFWLWSWALLITLCYWLCFALGGYAAARMTVLAPLRQGLGVWLWHILASLLASILVLFLGDSPDGHVPSLSFQAMLSGELQITLSATLVLLAILLLASLTGAILGPKYQQKIFPDHAGEN